MFMQKKNLLCGILAAMVIASFSGAKISQAASVAATAFPGADLGAKINAAFASLPAGAGEVVVSGGGTLATQVIVPKDKTLRFAAGTYALVKDPILMKENTEIVGSGWDTILVEPTTPNFWTVIAGYYGYTVNGDPDTNLVIRDLQIKGANPGFYSTPQTISLGNVKRGIVSGVWLNGTRTIGVQAGGSPYNGHWAEDVWFVNNKFTSVASQAVAGVNVRRMTIANNSFESPGQAGGPGNSVIDLEPNTNEDKLEEIAVLNNTLQAKSSVMCPHGNFILYQAFPSAPQTGGPAIIAGNSMEGDDLANNCFRTSNGISTSGGSYDVQIFNNSLRGCGQSCLWLRGTRLWVYNNTLINGGTGGLALVNIGTTKSYMFNNTFSAPYAGANTGVLEEAGGENGFYNNTAAVYSLRPSSMQLTAAPTPPAVAKASAPTVSIQSGSVVMNTTTSYAEIHYTTDGSEPTIVSPRYTGPFTVTGSAIIKARTFRAGIYDSEMVVQQMTGMPSPTPTPLVTPTPTPVATPTPTVTVTPTPTPTPLVSITPTPTPTPLSRLPFASNTLVNDGGTIYVVMGPAKIPFTSMRAFSGLGYSLKNVQKGSLSAYRMPYGSYLLSSGTMAHPWGAWVVQNKTVYLVHETGLVPVPTWEIFIANGGRAEHVVPANAADLAELRSGLPLLTSNDPRVVR